MTELQTREAHLELRDDENGRYVAGIAVPYGVETRVGDYIERVQKGAFDLTTDVPLFAGHDHKLGGLPIGRITKMEDRDEGLFIEAELAQTAKANEVHELLRGGYVKNFSIGFIPRETKRDGKVLVRTKADLKEVSVVGIPAYSAAAITEVRADEQEKEKTNETMELEEMRDAVSDLERRFAALEEGGSTEPAATKFRSYGEYVKAIASGDESAKEEYRAFTGATTGDSVVNNAWLNRAIKLVDENRTVLTAFNREPLPSEGNAVEYPVLTSTSVAVAAQAAEGDDLTYGEVVLDTATAPVKTYGGYSSLSFQTIQRSSVAYLDTVYRAQAIAYAKATNTAVRAAIVAASGTGTDTLSADTVAGWLDVLIDGAAYIQDQTGFNADFILVDKGVYKRMVSMTADDGRTLVELNGDGSNTIGSANVLNRKGQVAGLTILVDPSAAANTAVIASREAVTTWESGGPSRLQADNIINLTRDVSIYGYMAVGVTVPKGLVKLDVDLTP